MILDVLGRAGHPIINNYELWRVYNVDTRSPVAKSFPNPVDLLGRGLLRLELSTLRAFVEGKQ